MNTSYCGTLIRRSDRVSTIVAENVTDFIPADKTHFSVICGEAEKAGTLTICSENGFYQADTGVTALIGVRELTDNPTFRDVFFS